MALQPTRTSAVNIPDRFEVNIASGQAYVIQLDDEGNELESEGFLTSIHSWNKVYGNAKYENGNPKFKKKLQQL